ncbi:UNVERIFIED_CONTAM: hypothetical protein K2H54_058882 [Gekko kuhli]
MSPWSDAQDTTRPTTPDADDVPPVAQPSGHGTQETPVGDDCEAEEPLENQDRDPEQLPPNVYMADLTAGERAAFMKARKKRVSALQSIGELLAAQAREEHREAMREDQRNFQLFLTEMRTARQEDQDARAMMLAAMARSQKSTEELTSVVCLLVKAQVAHLATIQARNPERCTEAAQGAPSGRAAYGTDSGIQWKMPPQPFTFPPYTGAGAQALHPLEPQCRVIPRHPDTGGAGPLKPLGAPCTFYTPGRQFPGILDPRHTVNSDRSPLPRYLFTIGSKLQRYSNAAPTH